VMMAGRRAMTAGRRAPMAGCRAMMARSGDLSGGRTKSE
jgi:hypothetical protein